MNMMWKVVVFGAVVAMAGATYAGGSCCPSKSKEKSADKSMCSKATAGLDLTEEQKAKISEIQASCEAAGSSAEACGKAKTEIRDVLTDDQKAKFDASWDKASGGKEGCK